MGSKFILSGPDYDENFGFHLLENVDDGLDELIGRMQDAVLSLAPETVVYEKGDLAPGGWREDGLNIKISHWMKKPIIYSL